MKNDEAIQKEEAVAEKPQNNSGGSTRDNVVEGLILDTKMNKYDVVLLARRWAYELQAKDSSIHSVQDVITQSLGDILSGKVGAKSIRNLPPIRQAKKSKNANLVDSLAKAVLDTPSQSNSEKDKDHSEKSS